MSKEKPQYGGIRYQTSAVNISKLLTLLTSRERETARRFFAACTAIRGPRRLSHVGNWWFMELRDGNIALVRAPAGGFTEEEAKFAYRAGSSTEGVETELLTPDNMLLRLIRGR